MQDNKKVIQGGWGWKMGRVSRERTLGILLKEVGKPSV